MASITRRKRLFGHRPRGGSYGRRHIGGPHLGGGPAVGYGSPDDGQDYVDRSLIDFDPARGLYAGVAVTGPHAHRSAPERHLPDHVSIAQRAAEHDAAAEKIGHDPLAVRRHPSPEPADVAARQEIGHTP